MYMHVSAIYYYIVRDSIERSRISCALQAQTFPTHHVHHYSLIQRNVQYRYICGFVDGIQSLHDSLAGSAPTFKYLIIVTLASYSYIILQLHLSLAIEK